MEQEYCPQFVYRDSSALAHKIEEFGAKNGKIAETFGFFSLQPLTIWLEVLGSNRCVGPNLFKIIFNMPLKVLGNLIRNQRLQPTKELLGDNSTK